MALFGETKEKRTEYQPLIYDKEYKHTIVDSKYEPTTALLSMVQGTPVRVYYYRQSLGENEEPVGFQINDISTYQSYDLIKNLIIKLDGGRNFTPDVELAETSELGAAYVSMGIPPIRNDMFIMDVGDGRAGLFQIINQPELRTPYKGKAYYFEYKLLEYVNQEIDDKLTSKVINTYEYSKDSVLLGGQAVITTTEASTNKLAYKYIEILLDYYLSKFYFNSEQTLALPVKNLDEEDQEPCNNSYNVYDPYFVNYAISALPLQMFNRHSHITELMFQTSNKYGHDVPSTVWEVLRRGDFEMMPFIRRKMVLMGRGSFYVTRFYGNIYNSKFDLLVVNNPEVYQTGGQILYWDWDRIYIKEDADIREMDYIFTDGFYDGIGGNDFEKLLISFHKDKIVDKEAILNQAKNFTNFTNLEQFYYGPLLIQMLQRCRMTNEGF